MSDKMILPDVLRTELNLVFCGTAAGKTSAKKEAYYAGQGNCFYPVLYRLGYTDRRLAPQEFEVLLDYSIGLTDLAKYTFGLDSDLSDDDYDTLAFEKKILQYQPKIVCFNGKTAASKYLKIKDTKKISYGLQAQKINQTLLYVAPSTSPKASIHWDEEIWIQLKKNL